MNNNALLLRALRGPLTLILIGVLFVIEHAGVISVTKTWPLIIIFLGVMRLAEHTLTPPSATPPPFNPHGGPR